MTSTQARIIYNVNYFFLFRANFVIFIQYSVVAFLVPSRGYVKKKTAYIEKSKKYFTYGLKRFVICKILNFKGIGISNLPGTYSSACRSLKIHCCHQNVLFISPCRMTLPNLYFLQYFLHVEQKRPTSGFKVFLLIGFY